MRAVITAACLMVSLTAGAFTPALWENPPSVYTNTIGRELCRESLLRGWWTGIAETNWIIVQSVNVSVPANPAVMVKQSVSITNGLGSTFTAEVIGNTVTGVAPFAASVGESLTRKVEAVMGEYVLPYWTKGDDYSLDDWFAQVRISGTVTNRPDWWPDSDYPKPALMYHNPVIGMSVSGEGSNTVLEVRTNTWGEVTDYTQFIYTNPPTTNGFTITNYPSGHWIKRRARVDPLIIGEWRQYNAPSSWPGYTNNWEYYRGWPSEFVAIPFYSTPDYQAPESLLYGLEPDSYPVWVLHPGGTNRYNGTLSLSVNADDTGDSTPYLSTGNYPNTYEWSEGTHIVDYTYWYPATSTIPAPIRLNAMTPETRIANGKTNTVYVQRSDRAWLALGVPLMLTGVSPNTTVVTNVVEGVTNLTFRSGDTVSLQYTNRMSTYEGTRIWDNTLLPEQLNAHYAALTNLFLVKWDDWKWTNSWACTGAVVVTTHWAADSEVNITDGYLETNASPQPTSWQYWVNPANVASGIVAVGSISCEAEYPLAPAAAPMADCATIIEGGRFDETWNAISVPPPYELGPTSIWSVAVWRSEIPIVATARYSRVRSDMAITGLYTGTPHRAHIYWRKDYGAFTNAADGIEWWHRGTPGDVSPGVWPYGFVNDNTVVAKSLSVESNSDAYVSCVVSNQQSGPYQIFKLTSAYPYYNLESGPIAYNGGFYTEIAAGHTNYYYLGASDYTVTNWYADDYDYWEVREFRYESRFSASTNFDWPVSRCGWVVGWFEDDGDFVEFKQYPIPEGVSYDVEVITATNMSAYAYTNSWIDDGTTNHVVLSYLATNGVVICSRDFPRPSGSIQYSGDGPVLRAHGGGVYDNPDPMSNVWVPEDYPSTGVEPWGGMGEAWVSGRAYGMDYTNGIQVKVLIEWQK